MAASNPLSSSSSLGSFANGVGDLFSAFGDFAEGASYGTAATLAKQNAQITAESTRIQESQAGRAITQTIGAQKADVAGNGLAESGSALALLQSSAAQGTLQKQIIQTQGLVTEGGFEQESAAYSGMQQAANAAGAAGIVNGLGNIAGSIFGI